MKKDTSFPQVYVVKASAGSGKTYALARHYLKLLLSEKSSPEEVENILAITFTNKASREMKERISDLLKRLALDKFADPREEEELLSSIHIDKKQAQAKARQLISYIISNYNFFQVKTIDSFINMILLGCAWSLGLSSRFKIQDNPAEYLRYGLYECIDTADKDKKIQKVFENFLHQYIYLVGRRSWLPTADMLVLMDSMLYHLNVFGGRFRKFDLKKESIFKEKQQLLALYRRLRENLPEGTSGTFSNTLDNFLEENSEIFDFQEISRRKTFLGEMLPVSKTKSVPERIAKLWDNIRLKTRVLAEKEARAFFNCYIDIFDMVYQSLRNLAAKEDVLFLEELNQQAQLLINENGITVPELYYRLAARLKHFLIDEFQDTSLLQWQNLYPMIEEAISQGGSLFCVGDKKQAIFFFF